MSSYMDSIETGPSPETFTAKALQGLEETGYKDTTEDQTLSMWMKNLWQVRIDKTK